MNLSNNSTRRALYGGAKKAKSKAIKLFGRNPGGGTRHNIWIGQRNLAHRCTHFHRRAEARIPLFSKDDKGCNVGRPERGKRCVRCIERCRQTRKFWPVVPDN